MITSNLSRDISVLDNDIFNQGRRDLISLLKQMPRSITRSSAIKNRLDKTLKKSDTAAIEVSLIDYLTAHDVKAEDIGLDDQFIAALLPRLAQLNPDW